MLTSFLLVTITILMVEILSRPDKAREGYFDAYCFLNALASDYNNKDHTALLSYLNDAYVPSKPWERRLLLHVASKHSEGQG